MSDELKRTEELADLDLIEETADKYAEFLRKEMDAGRASIHPPHAIVHYAHKVFHQIFEPLFQEAMVEIAERNEAFQQEGEQEIAYVDGSTALENTIRLCVLNAFTLGYEFRDKGLSVHPCRCGELDDDKIKEVFGEGFKCE